MQWILDNKEWLFSGLGIFILTLIFSFFAKNKNVTKQSQKSGKYSKNYQSARDIHIGKTDD